MLPNVRLVLVAIAVALAALLSAGRGLVTSTEGLGQVSAVPGVGRVLVQQAILGNPEAQLFSRLASARRAEEIERLRDLPVTPMRIEPEAGEGAPSFAGLDGSPREVVPSADLELRPALAAPAVPTVAAPAGAEPDEAADTTPVPHPATIVVPAEAAGEPAPVPAPALASLPTPAEAVDAEDVSPVPTPDPTETAAEPGTTPSEATGALQVRVPLPPVRREKPVVRKKPHHAPGANRASIASARLRNPVTAPVAQSNASPFTNTAYRSGTFYPPLPWLTMDEPANSPRALRGYRQPVGAATH